MHPFPILERWVDVDVVNRRTGVVAVRKNTQVFLVYIPSRGVFPNIGCCLLPSVYSGMPVV